MKKELDKIIENLSRQVLSSEHIDYENEYIQRLNFLYYVPLSSLFDEKYDELLFAVVEEIKEFEQIELKNTLLFLDDFGKITPEIAVQVFSIVSYDLAKWRLHGKIFLHLSYLLNESYVGLLSSNVVLDADSSKCEMVISETLLDFDFATCKSENTSFRLLHYINSLN